MLDVQTQALAVLQAASMTQKTEAAHVLKALWHADALSIAPNPPTALSDQPARPEQPALVDPAQVKRRRLGSEHGRIALLHAIAHIEFNAIDLAADMVARFAASDRIADTERQKFIQDWVGVCDDEARHFSLVQTRLTSLNAGYGDLDAHNGLWEAAIATKDDLAARLAIAPMVLEARGLDVTPGMIKKLRTVGDLDSAAILETIYTEEIAHVRAGTYWFSHICVAENRRPYQYFKHMIEHFFSGQLKPPFNEEARTLAGFPRHYYLENSGAD